MYIFTYIYINIYKYKKVNKRINTYIYMNV